MDKQHQLKCDRIIIHNTIKKKETSNLLSIKKTYFLRNEISYCNFVLLLPGTRVDIKVYIYLHKSSITRTSKHERNNKCFVLSQVLHNASVYYTMIKISTLVIYNTMLVRFYLQKYLKRTPSKEKLHSHRLKKVLHNLS